MHILVSKSKVGHKSKKHTPWNEPAQQTGDFTKP